MSLVSAAWSIFGSAFGSAMLLCLFWKRFNYQGACASIIAGFCISLLWLVCFNLEYYLGADVKSLIYNTKLYEIVPGFIVSLIVGIVVALKTKEPSKEVVEIFEQVDNFVEEIESV
jgi:sodium/proline symporter